MQDVFEDRLELEAKILVAALKQSIDSGDALGADLASKHLSHLLRARSSQSKIQPYDDEPPPAPKQAKPLKKAESNFENIGIYALVGANPLCSAREIHVKFLRSVRRLIGSHKKNKHSADREFKSKLREVWIAHDLLTDNVTRCDYDFALLCPNHMEPGKVKVGHLGFKIGQLLELAQFLEPSELHIAQDMHKALPEVRFGEFMVNQGYLTSQELEDSLLAQTLIKNGKLSLAQFQTAIKDARSEQASLEKVLSEYGWAQPD